MNQQREALYQAARDHVTTWLIEDMRIEEGTSTGLPRSPDILAVVTGYLLAFIRNEAARSGMAPLQFWNWFCLRLAVLEQAREIARDEE